MPVRKILVPIDYSERSRIAMDYALHVADALEGQVIVLHVIPIRAVRRAGRRSANWRRRFRMNCARIRRAR
jgi:nucleotide-binding universal stress UspA family protein